MSKAAIYTKPVRNEEVKDFTLQSLLVLSMTLLLLSELGAILFLIPNYKENGNTFQNRIQLSFETPQPQQEKTACSNVSQSRKALLLKSKKTVKTRNSAPLQTARKERSSKRFPLLSNPSSWPPVENRPYPDMELINQDGTTTRLSNLAGEVIIIQHVAMNCPVSQAWTGANEKDKKAYGLCFPSRRIKTFTDTMKEFTGIDPLNSGINFVQIIYYDMEGKNPTLEDAKAWADHFDLRTAENEYVLIANEKMAGRKSNLLIPGFHLIDRAFVLRSDCAGPLSKRNLYNHFFTQLSSMIPESIISFK